MFALTDVHKATHRDLTEVEFGPEAFDRFEAVLRPDEYRQLLGVAQEARRLLQPKTVWNITSTSRGGGVAEMLTSLLPLAKGAGVNVRWLVIQASEEFFRLTKRIHNRLHGNAGDGGELGVPEHAFYEKALRTHAETLRKLVNARDLVVLHDPQTAGLAPALHRAGVQVIWRCHVGVDESDALVRSAWDFLLPYLQAADSYVFTREAYAGNVLDRSKLTIIPPSIDIFSPKNQSLSVAQVNGILATTRLVEEAPGEYDNTFERVDGTTGVVTAVSDLSGGGPVPRGKPIVTQISRWDRLKDPFGLIRGFVEHVVDESDAHLVVAGPAVAAVADDPEGFEVLSQVRGAWATLPARVRERVHLACLPMFDVEENAAIVNALQRRASIVVQKSIAEGFGLTVAEAMWKERAVVASRVGGIQDQLVDGVSGLLVDPMDLRAYGESVLLLLEDEALAHKLGAAAHTRCREEYLGPRHLIRYVKLFEQLFRAEVS